VKAGHGLADSVALGEPEFDGGPVVDAAVEAGDRASASRPDRQNAAIACCSAVASLTASKTLDRFGRPDPSDPVRNAIT
jgi:hypothetical protein